MKEQYHFIGIGGIGMSGLARMLLQNNISVSGSDIASSSVVEGLVNEGAVVHLGHAAEHVKEGMIVIYSSDIKLDNPEYLAAQKLKCSLWHRSDLLAHMMQDQTSLAVAGTHGKTTTSALLSSVLIEAGWDPTIVVGGVIPQYQCNARLGNGKGFVFEADESDGTFLKYHPFGAIVTNIDNDHLINFQNSEKKLIEAFKTFMSQITSTNHLFWCGDDPHLKTLNLQGQRYGVSEECDWRLSNLRQNGFQSTFDLESQCKRFADIELSLIGKHNALNAAAVFGVAMTLEIPQEAVRLALKNFKGVLRRCEIKGESQGILFIDDYAHHPTEIETTLKGIRQAIGSRRMIVVFQPHRYSRTKDCLGMYGSIFESTDQLIVTDIYGAGEEPINDLHSGLIVNEIKAASKIECQYVERQMMGSHLVDIVQPDDVVVTLGAGDVTKVAKETMNLFESLLKTTPS